VLGHVSISEELNIKLVKLVEEYPLLMTGAILVIQDTKKMD